jgi:hypothetical protein
MCYIFVLSEGTWNFLRFFECCQQTQFVSPHRLWSRRWVWYRLTFQESDWRWIAVDTGCGTKYLHISGLLLIGFLWTKVFECVMLTIMYSVVADRGFSVGKRYFIQQKLQSLSVGLHDRTLQWNMAHVLGLLLCMQGTAICFATSLQDY